MKVIRGAFFHWVIVHAKHGNQKFKPSAAIMLTRAFWQHHIVTVQTEVPKYVSDFTAVLLTYRFGTVSGQKKSFVQNTSHDSFFSRSILASRDKNLATSKMDDDCHCYDCQNAGKTRDCQNAGKMT